MREKGFSMEHFNKWSISDVFVQARRRAGRSSTPACMHGLPAEIALSR